MPGVGEVPVESDDRPERVGTESDAEAGFCACGVACAVCSVMGVFDWLLSALGVFVRDALVVVRFAAGVDTAGAAVGTGEGVGVGSGVAAVLAARSRSACRPEQASLWS